MKLRMSLLSLGLVSLPALAVTPFTYSGAQISEIFSGQSHVWKKVHGAVEQITFKSYDAKLKTSIFHLTTTEHVPVINDHGVTVGYKPTPCLVSVGVTNIGDDMAHKLKVTSVDYSACPSVKP